MNAALAAWPRTAKIIGDAETLSDLFEFDAETLTAACAAAFVDLADQGPEAAYATALKAEAILGPQAASDPLLCSAQVIARQVPAALCLAQARALSVAQSYEAASSVADRGFQAAIDADTVISRLLDGHNRNQPEDDLDASVVSLAPSEDSGDHRFASGLPDGIDLESALEMLGDALYVVHGAGDMGPYSLYCATVVNECEISDRHIWWLKALDLTELADVLEMVTSFAFVDSPPPSWGEGAWTIGELLRGGHGPEALRLLAHMDPSRDGAVEVGTKALPDLGEDSRLDIPDYDEWEEQRAEWNSVVVGSVEERRFWLQTARAHALRLIGDHAGAARTIPSRRPYVGTSDHLGPDPSAITEYWAHNLGYLEGMASRLHDDRNEDLVRAVREIQDSQRQVRDSQQRGERLLLEGRTRAIGLEKAIDRVAGDVGALAELMQEVPSEVSMRMRNEWKADEEFRQTRDALFRAWADSNGTDEVDEATSEARELVGEVAWGLLCQDSRDDLLGTLLVKQHWPEKHYALRAVGACRAFERELREAVRRRADQSVTIEVGYSTLGTLLNDCRKLVPDDRLYRIAQRAQNGGVDGLRNRAAHPNRFTEEDSMRMEQILFHDGLDGKGLIGLLATYGRARTPE